MSKRQTMWVLLSVLLLGVGFALQPRPLTTAAYAGGDAEAPPLLGPGPATTPELQALAVALMMNDFGLIFDTHGPMDPTLNLAPYWPVDAHDQFWSSGTASDWTPGTPQVRRDHGWVETIILPDGRELNPNDVRVFTDPAQRRPANAADRIPADFVRARMLLRPVQVWLFAHPGEDLPQLVQVYRDLGLVANVGVLGDLQASFDRMQLLRLAGSPERIGLSLQLEDRDWLWEWDLTVRPTAQKSGFALHYHADAGARALAKNGREAWGTLRDLSKAAEPMRLAWMAREQSVFLEMQQDALENRAKLTLRALGSSQLAYQDQNLQKNYGSWANLLDTNYIQRGYSRSNIIDSYSLAVFYARPSTIVNGRSLGDSRFTIVALPYPAGLGLRTFAICDDQTVRVATDFLLNIVPNHENYPPTGDSPCEWEPLR